MNTKTAATRTAAAQARYFEQQVAIEKHIKSLQAKLAAHQKRHQADPANWGYVGDLGYILEQLRNADTFLQA